MRAIGALAWRARVCYTPDQPITPQRAVKGNGQQTQRTGPAVESARTRREAEMSDERFEALRERGIQLMGEGYA
jgi:hypothetical protein